jgi:hypothetical protein
MEGKRKKYFTKGEVIDEIKGGKNVKDIVTEICETLCPHATEDLDEIDLDKLEEVSKAFTAKIYRIQRDLKEKKYRRRQEQLEDKYMSCSQGSILQSDSSQNLQSDSSQSAWDYSQVGLYKIPSLN